MTVQLDTGDLDRYGSHHWFDDGDDQMVGKWAASTDTAGTWIIRASTDPDDDWRAVSCIGTPVVDVATIRRLVPCTDAALGRYRAETGRRTDLQPPTNQEQTP